jgi:predicted flap endonuclease-1-like 5' DNA nuclease
MGRFTDDMTRLRGETDALRNVRQGFIIDLKRGIEDLKEEVVGMQSGFRNDHSGMAENLRRGLGTFMSDLQTSVNGMTADFRSDRENMAKTTKSEREEFIVDIKETVASLCDETETMMTGFRNDHSGMAENLRQGLGTFMSDLQTSVNGMTADFRSDRENMAKTTKLEREEFIANTLQAVNDLKQNVSTFRTSFLTDFAGGQQAWSGTLQPVPKKVEVDSREKIAKPIVKEEKVIVDKAIDVQAKEEPKIEQVASQDEILKTEEKIVPDDLTKIKGIGSSREKQFNNGGIYTFAQLAGSSIEDLEKIMGGATRIVPIEKWIEQANKLRD